MDDDLAIRFELARQSIAGWSADTVALVGAASESRQTGVANPGQIEAGQRMRDAVQAEQQSLAAAAAAVPAKSDGLARGIEIALNELQLLHRDIGAALKDLQGTTIS